MRCLSILAGVLLLSRFVSAAPTLQLSSSSLPSDSNATLTNTISGLANGETVTVDRIADLNGNGAVDSGEPVLRSFKVTDGVRPIIGGVVNGNVPGDNDAAANGAIRIDLPFGGVDSILNRQPGKYVIRITGASGQTTQPFEMTAPVLPQHITGVLKNSTDNSTIPSGFVVVLIGNGDPIGSVRTDTAGAFNIVLPPGDYGLVAFADGFVAPFQSATLAANQTLTKNLTLTPAPVRVSGKLTDAASAAPLPSVFILAQADSGTISGALTDGNGNYAFSVAADSWEINPFAEQLAQLGYVSEDKGVMVTASSTPLTVNLTAAKGTSLFYGKVLTAPGAPIPNLTMRAKLQNASPGLECIGKTTGSGDYFIVAADGAWELQTRNASLSGFQDQTRSATISAATAVKSDFTLLGFTAHIRGRVVDSANNGISGVFLEAHFENSMDSTSGSNTGNDGSFDIPVSAGNWTLRLSEDAQLISHDVQVTVVDGVDQTLTYVVPAATGHISGNVKTSANAPISGIFVFASATIGNTYYQTGASTDPSGNYQFPVINGTWSVSLSCGDLQSAGNFDCPNNQNTAVNNNNPVVNFTVAQFVTTASINGKLVDSTGAGISGGQVDAALPGGVFRNANTASDGSFSIPVYAGQWIVQLANPPPSLIGPNIQFTVTDGVNINNVIVKVYPADAGVTGIVKNPSGAGVAGVHLYASTTINNVQYSVPNAVTDQSGQFNFQLSRGSWFISADCGDLSGQSFDCIQGQTIDTSGGTATVTFNLTKTQPQIIAPHIQQNGQTPMLAFTIQGNPGTYDVQGRADLPSSITTWPVITTVAIPVGNSSIPVLIDPQGNRFFRAVRR